MHMPVAKLFKHSQLEKCHKATERRLRQRDVEIAARCGEMEFSLEGGEEEERVYHVATFQYMGRPLDQTDDNWPAVQWIIMRARSVWGRLGTLLLREGSDPRVAEMFYRAVVQEILMYGSETWVLLAAMERKAEGMHTGLLIKIRGSERGGYETGHRTQPGRKECRRQRERS